MAIHQEETKEISGGFLKGIDSGAQQIVFDLFQKSQYQFPIKSTIREVVSNGLDSLKEKFIAIDILTGVAKVEDYYVVKEGEAYKDSKFNPNYYDLKYLSDINEVDVIYYDRGTIGKDSIVIRDHGVGLGGSRLVGYFSIGYSSKRLSSFALGKFGLGAKSPLATNAPYYTVTSRYNGQEFKFNIYSMKFESIVPKYDFEGMAENPHIFLPGLEDSNGPVPIYYRHTHELNMFQVEIPAKKHHKQQYIDAVTSQLLYFKNVRLFVDEEGDQKEIPVKANIMYEDDLIILSNNSPYQKPHLLLNGVNYGYVNFEELELEAKLGNVGIKVPADSVSVTPSRESLIWDDITRETILEKFNGVVKIAENIINQQLNEMDFLKWLKLCAEANTSRWRDANNNSVIGRLSNLIDVSKVELVYPGNKYLKFNPRLLDGMNVKTVRLETLRKGKTTRIKVHYYESWHSSAVEGLPIIVQHKPISNRKNKYILTHLYKNGYISIHLDATGTVTREDLINVPKARLEWLLPTDYDRNSDSAKRLKMRENAFDKIAFLHNLILASKDYIKYEDINVPDDFKATENEEDELTENEEDELTEVEETVESVAKEASLAAKERRKLEGKTIIHVPRIPWSVQEFNKGGYSTMKSEFKISKVDEWTNEEIFWTNDNTYPLMNLAAFITRPLEEEYRVVKIKDSYKAFTEYGLDIQDEYIPWTLDEAPVRLFKVSQENTKYYKDFKHISYFFKIIKNKTLTMANALVRWNTARIMYKNVHELKFLTNFRDFSIDKNNDYADIVLYIESYYRSITNANIIKSDKEAELTTYLDKVGDFQLFVTSHPNETEAIASLAKELFNPGPGVEINNARAIDLDIYTKYVNLLDWATSIMTMLNMVYPLLSRSETITEEQQEEIRHYMKYRGVTF